MKNPQELIGRKVRGFKFEPNKNVGYSILLDCKIGVIKKINDSNVARVLFEDKNIYYYPADQIEAHLVDDEIPIFTKESTEYDLLQHIKFCIECKNESQAIRLIEKYAFEKQPINNEEIPTLSDGVMMLVSDDEEDWCKREVLFKFKSIYIAVNCVNDETITQWKYCKPLEPTKEEQLTAILGSSEKVSEIMELFKK
jgi:hypothetical protein